MAHRVYRSRLIASWWEVVIEMAKVRGGKRRDVVMHIVEPWWLAGAPIAPDEGWMAEMVTLSSLLQTGWPVPGILLLINTLSTSS